MTENEAMKEVTSWTSILLGSGKCTEETACAQDMAIKALEEIQQYRAIGTVEECRAAVEIHKALYERKLTPEDMEEYMKFEDECVKKGFTFKSMLDLKHGTGGQTMGRLIDEDDVISLLTNHHFDDDKENFDLLIHNLCKEVKCISTAYDVDAVEKRLKSQKEVWNDKEVSDARLGNNGINWVHIANSDTVDTQVIVALGTGTSFNVSSYEGYKSFTLNDFIVEPVVGAFSNMSKCGKVDNYNVTGIVKLNVTKSYNASTGILTASVTASGGFGTNNSGNFSGSSSTATSMKAFLIMK